MDTKFDVRKTERHESLREGRTTFSQPVDYFEYSHNVTLTLVQDVTNFISVHAILGVRKYLTRIPINEIDVFASSKPVKIYMHCCSVVFGANNCRMMAICTQICTSF